MWGWRLVLSGCRVPFWLAAPARQPSVPRQGMAPQTNHATLTQKSHCTCSQRKNDAERPTHRNPDLKLCVGLRTQIPGS
eukprot:2445653-Alexandrium_andersonii.AAC.1